MWKYAHTAGRGADNRVYASYTSDVNKGIEVCPRCESGVKLIVCREGTAVIPCVEAFTRKLEQNNTESLLVPVTYTPTNNITQIMHVWFPGDSGHQLLQLFHESMQPWLVETYYRSDADFWLLDWRTGSSIEPLSFIKKSELTPITQSTPILIVIDEKTNLPDRLASSTYIDITNCEFINVVELKTTILEARIKKLLRSGKKRLIQNTAKSNAEIILQAVMKYSNDWLVVKSIDNRFLYVSRKFCQAYEKTADEILGLDDLELGIPAELVLGNPSYNWKGFWEQDKEVIDCGVPLVDTPILVSEELNMYESMDKVPLRDQNGEIFALVVCVYRFIQNSADSPIAEKTFEKDGKSTQLWSQKQVLADKPALFTTNIERLIAEEQKHKSERAFIAKNRFIATASHDLRQPLHALGLYIDVLESTISVDDQGLIDDINSCLDALNALLTSLLDISKLDANVVDAQMSNFKVGKLLQSLQTECHSIARDKSLNIYCSADESFVNSDEILLRRVIRNLIMNAINYTKNGDIKLTATLTGSHVEIVVADTGFGIPEDQQKLIFEEFVRIESTPEEVKQGLGLGLSIVKRLCIILNIGLRLDSKVGVGTQVYLMIPRGADRDNHAVEPEQLPASSLYSTSDSPDHSKTLLVIDDELQVCKAMEALLRNYDYEVVSATSPERAITALRKSSVLPDAMIVDFRLSKDVTGLDAIEMISKEFSVSIPALIVTGDTTGDGLTEITGSGYQHIHKPVEPRKLLSMIRDTLNSSCKG